MIEGIGFIKTVMNLEKRILKWKLNFCLIKDQERKWLTLSVYSMEDGRGIRIEIRHMSKMNLLFDTFLNLLWESLSFPFLGLSGGSVIVIISRYQVLTILSCS